MNKDAPYEIKLEDRGDYLYVLVGGKVLTPKIARMYWDEIADECFKLGKSKIMIEKDFPQSVSPPEMLEMAAYLGKVLPGKKIAFYDRYKNESINELGKVLARNYGVMLRVFSVTKEAEKWLVGN